jgi:hypothetical protein
VMSDSALKSRFVANLKHCPQVLRTQYTGAFTVECVGNNIEKLLLEEKMLPTNNFVRSVESCDTHALSFKVMNALPQEMQPEHHHGNILDRLPSHVKAALNSIKWPERSHAKQNRMKAMCESIDCVVEVNNVLATCTYATANLKSMCLKHGGRCSIKVPHEAKAKITMNWSGLVCLDVTQFGDELYAAGPHMLPQLGWMHERGELQEKFVVAECGPNWTGGEDIRARLPKHHVEENLLCPSQWGNALGRRRKWVTANRYRTTMSLQEFLEKTGAFKTCMCPGSMYYCEHKDICDKALAVRAAGLGMMPHEVDGWQSVLSGAHRVYLDTAREMRKKRDAKKGPQPAWIVDLEHHPESIDRTSKDETVRVPCLLRHSSFWLEIQSVPDDEHSIKESRLMLKRELLSCQGHITIPEAHGEEFGIQWADLLDTMPERDVQRLSGNAMHCEIVTYIWYWFLSCSEIDDHEDSDDDDDVAPTCIDKTSSDKASISSCAPSL